MVTILCTSQNALALPSCLQTHSYKHFSSCYSSDHAAAHCTEVTFIHFIEVNTQQLTFLVRDRVPCIQMQEEPMVMGYIYIQSM